MTRVSQGLGDSFYVLLELTMNLKHEHHMPNDSLTGPKKDRWKRTLKNTVIVAIIAWLATGGIVVGVFRTFGGPTIRWHSPTERAAEIDVGITSPIRVWKVPFLVDVHSAGPPYRIGIKVLIPSPEQILAIHFVSIELTDSGGRVHSVLAESGMTVLIEARKKSSKHVAWQDDGSCFVFVEKELDGVPPIDWCTHVDIRVIGSLVGDGTEEAFDVQGREYRSTTRVTVLPFWLYLSRL